MNALLKENFKFLVVMLALVLIVGFWISGRSGPTRVWNWTRGDRTKINNRGDGNKFDWRKDIKVDEDEDPDETEDERRRRRRRILGSDGNELNESDEMDQNTIYVLVGLAALASGWWFLWLNPEQRKNMFKRNSTDPDPKDKDSDDKGSPEKDSPPTTTRDGIFVAFCLLRDSVNDTASRESLDAILSQIMESYRDRTDDAK